MRSTTISQVIVFFAFWVTLFGYQSYAYTTEIGTCQKAAEDEESKAPHLFFTIEQGKALLAEIKELRITKQRVQLIETKLKLQEEMMSLRQLQLKQTEEAFEAQNKRVIVLNTALIDEKNQKEEYRKEAIKWSQEAAKYKGQRYEFLIWGVAGGVVLTAAVVLVIVLVPKAVPG